MSLLDILVMLIAALIFFFAHTALVPTIIGTLIVLALVRIMRGERL